MRYTFKGRDLDELTHEELLDATKRLIGDLRQLREWQIEADKLSADLDRALNSVRRIS